MRSFMGAHRLVLHLENTGLSKLSWQDGRWHLEYLNWREHLLDAGLEADDVRRRRTKAGASAR